MLSRIRTFRRSMFTAAMPTDRTRWKQITGCVGEPFNVCMKYGAEFADALHGCGIRTPPRIEPTACVGACHCKGKRDCSANGNNISER